MPETVFYEIEFLLLVVASLLLPCTIYAFLLFRKVLSQWMVLILAIVLIVLSGVDVVLLQMLAEMARKTASAADDRWFVGGLSMALYLLPATFGGIGVNLLSHVLIRHLGRAELNYENDRRRLR